MCSRVSICLAFLTLLTASAQAQASGSGGSTKQQFSAALDAADEYMKQGALDMALQAFEAAHALKPSDVYTMHCRSLHELLPDEHDIADVEVHFVCISI